MVKHRKSRKKRPVSFPSIKKNYLLFYFSGLGSIKMRVEPELLTNETRWRVIDGSITTDWNWNLVGVTVKPSSESPRPDPIK